MLLEVHSLDIRQSDIILKKGCGEKQLAFKFIHGFFPKIWGTKFKIQLQAV